MEEVNKKHSRVVQALAEVKDYHYELKRKSRKLKQLTKLASNTVFSWNAAENKITVLENDKKELTENLSEAMDRVNKAEEEMKKAKESEERLKLAEEKARTDKDAVQKNLNLLTKKFEDMSTKWEKEVIARQGLERKLGTTESDLELEQQKSLNLQRSLNDAKKENADQAITIMTKDVEIENLKKRISELEPLTEPYPHILNWVQQDAYRQAASVTESFAGPDAGQTVRKAVLEIDPNFPLDTLRVFPSERIKKDGSTMVQKNSALPPIFFDSDGLDYEDILDRIGSALSKNLVYESPEPQDDEVLLSPEWYEKFRKDHETALRKRERMRICHEQGTRYESSEDEDEEVPSSVQPSTVPSSSGLNGQASLS